MPTVLRRRVQNRIAQALHYPVTVLRAPAGFGKSTALAQSFERRNVIRYTLAPDVETPWDFVRGFAGALREVCPAVHLSFAGAWERAAESNSPAEHLARWMHSHLEGAELTLAFDQLHSIGGNEDVERFLSRMVDLSPASMRWVFSIRTALDLPIPRWLADGRMDVPVDAEFLRFDLEEITCAAQLVERACTEGEAAEIARATNGWPMGVMFALRNAAHGERCVAHPESESFALLADRVFLDCSDREREFLLSTCLLPRLDEELCRAAGFGDAAQLVRALEADAGLIFAEVGGVRQYHDGFAKYLQDVLRSRGAVHFNAVLTIAASALEELGRLDEALHLVTKYELRGEIARMLDRYGLGLVEAGEDQTVKSALAVLGSPSDDCSGQILALKAIFELRAGRFDTSDAWLAVALERTTGVLRAEIAYRCASEMLQRRRAEPISLLEPYSSDRALPARLRVSILSALASAHMQAGSVSKANRCIRDALGLASAVSDPEVQVALDVRAAYVLLYSGHPKRAKELAARGGALAEQSSQFRMAASAYSTLYAAAADDDDPAACLDYLSHIAENAAKSGNQRMQLVCARGAL